MRRGALRCMFGRIPGWPDVKPYLIKSIQFNLNTSLEDLQLDINPEPAAWPSIE